MRILFITANRIGDAVLTTGLLHHLVKTYPEARFTIACGPVTADLFRATPRLENLIRLQKQKRHGHWIDLWKTCVTTKWDIIIDLRNSLITRLLWSQKKYYRLSHNTGRHKVEDHASVMKLSPPPAPHIWTDEAAESNATKLIQDESKILALGPSANWPPKQWPIARYAELTKRLTQENGPLQDAKIMLLAAPHEKDQLALFCESFPKEKIIDLVGQDLLTVAACLKHATFFIGNDSGLTHIAAAMGTKTLALFGPGWEEVYGPWGAHASVLRPRFGSQELLDRLPYVGADAPNLMEDIEVETVVERIQNIL
ncbi:MAG: glycosyltransferase family 9 protein [Bdellovibrionales bacterium]